MVASVPVECGASATRSMRVARCRGVASRGAKVRQAGGTSPSESSQQTPEEKRCPTQSWQIPVADAAVVAHAVVEDGDTPLALVARVGVDCEGPAWFAFARAVVVDVVGVGT